MKNILGESNISLRKQKASKRQRCQGKDVFDFISSP